MKFNTLLFLIVLLCNLTNAQWKQTSGPTGAIVELLAANQVYIFAALYEHGIFRSSDNGLTWQDVNIGLPKVPEYVTYNTLVTYDKYVLLGTNKGLYISKNDGDNWLSIGDQLYDKNVTTLIVRKNKIIVGTYWGHVFNSSDFGKNWSDIGNLSPIRINTFAEKNDTLFAGTYNGVYFSIDEGFNWNPLHNDGMYSQSISDIIIEGNEIYVSSENGHGVSVSTDGGYRWNSIWNKLLPEIVYSLKRVGEKIYAGTTRGLYKFDKSSSSWNYLPYGELEITTITNKEETIFAGFHGAGILYFNINDEQMFFINKGLPFSSIKSIVAQSSKLYASTYHSGIFITSDYGNNWISLNNPQASSIFPKDNLLFGYNERSLYASFNEGLSWSLLNSVPNNVNFIIYKIVTDGSNLFLGTRIINPFEIGSRLGGVYCSKDNGETWENISEGLPSTSIGYLDYIEDKLIVSTNGGVFLSTNKGVTWTADKSGLNNKIVQIVFDNGKYFAITEEQVYSSTDNWKTWQSINFDVANSYLLTIASRGNKLFVGTNKGVFLFEVNKNIWKPANNGLANTYVSALLIAYDQLFAGTSGDAIWKCSIDDTITSVFQTHLPESFSLSQNYPNPFNPSTTIQYQIPVGEALSGAEVHVSLKVYDLLGREVATLVNEYKQPGTYNSKLNAQNFQLPSGVYFYRLQSGSYNETKKLILMK